MPRFTVAAVITLLLAAVLVAAQPTPAKATPAGPHTPQYKTMMVYNWDRASLSKAVQNGDYQKLIAMDLRTLPVILNAQSAQGWQLVAAIPQTRDLSVLNNQHTQDIRAEMEQIRLVFRKDS